MPDRTTKIAVGKYDGATGHMSFELALDAMKRGCKVRRSIWSQTAFIFLNGDQLTTSFGRPMPNIEWHMLADDWVEVF